MSLVELPNEILAQILNHLDINSQQLVSAQPAHCALALTSSRFTYLVQSVLLRRLVFELYLGNYDPQQNPRLEQLLTACTLNHSLGDLVQTVEIKSVITDLELSSAETTILKAFFKLIASVSNLSKLIVEPLPLPLWSVFREPTGTSFGNLKFLSLASHIYCPISADQVAKFCRLPKLEDLALDATIICSRTSAVEKGSQPVEQPLPGSHETSNAALHNRISLRRLTLWSKAVIHPDALTSTLPYADRLLALRLKVRGIGRYDPSSIRQNGQKSRKSLVQPLKPSYIQNLLLPIKNNLQELCLDSKQLDFSSHDGSTFDASSFLQLRFLSIGSRLMFIETSNPRQQSQRTDSVWKLLPRSLEKLEILFDGDQGILCSLRRMRQILETGLHVSELWQQLDGSADVTMSRLRWLTEILKRKRTHFPQLGQINVHETSYHIENFAWQIVNWPLANDLRKLCEKDDICLSIHLRVPLEWETEAEVIEGWHDSLEALIRA